MPLARLPTTPVMVPGADKDARTIEVRAIVRPVIRLGIDGHHAWRHRTSLQVEVGRDHVADAPLPIRRAPLTRTSGDLYDGAAWNHGDHPKGRAGPLPKIGVGKDPRWTGRRRRNGKPEQQRGKPSQPTQPSH